MAKFVGVKCDGPCGQVLDKKDVTRVTHTFKGPALSGSYEQDLCSDCLTVPPGITLRPLRRQGQQAGSQPAAADRESPTPD